MKKKYRVKKSDEFQEIMSNRKFTRSRSFIVYMKDKKKDHARIGISVPKKFGNAVLRNKTKRQVREMMRPMELNGASKDLIVIVRKGYQSHNYDENQKDLENVLKHGKI